jgi:hypothetical protein
MGPAAVKRVDPCADCSTEDPRMTPRQLHQLLRGLDDAGEVVYGRGPSEDVLHAVWRSAQEEADQAYGRWAEIGGREAYLAYRAAADRADAAMDALAGASLADAA